MPGIVWDKHRQLRRLNGPAKASTRLVLDALPGRFENHESTAQIFETIAASAAFAAMKTLGDFSGGLQCLSSGC